LDTEVTVLIPAFNEEKYIAGTVYGIKACGGIIRVIVMDDGSTDGTARAASGSGAEVIKLKKNMGKGCALNYGLKSVNSGIIAFIDADIGTGSKELEKLLEPIIKDKADMTIGVLQPVSGKGGFGLVKKLSRLLLFVSTGRTLTAGLSGQRVFKREVLDEIAPISDGFAAEIGMNIKAMKKGYRVLEVPVNMTHRETKRDLKGFLHRGRQFYDILKYYFMEMRGSK
jgi:glycosyltransferase involved in cell wall biosynthesis